MQAMRPWLRSSASRPRTPLPNRPGTTRRRALPPRPGVENGQFLAEIDGEPMFALAGAVPAWRALIPGESGPDVAELQKALAALGYGDGGDTSGYFGAGTKDAVSAYYDHLGYAAPTTGAATHQAVNQAQKAVTSDQQQIAQLEAKPQNSQTKEQLDAAEKQLTTDESALSAAEAVNGPPVPQGNGDLTGPFLV